MAAFEGNLTYHAFGSRLLKLTTPNMTGTDVKVLQVLFNQLLAITRPPLGPIGTSVTPDGIYGSKTQTAVRNLQSYFGLSVDGVAGQNTYRALGQMVQSYVTYGGPAFGSRSLSPGASGGDVRVLQNRLNMFRYATALGGPADGIYGTKTGTAVTQFRTDAENNGDTGLGVTDTMGPSGLDAAWIYTYAGGRNLAQGAAGLDAAFVQYVLASLTNPGTGRPFYSAAVDGYYGSASASAVRTFQQTTGISADGIAGPQTYYQFGLHNQVGAPAPAPVPGIG